MSEYVNIVYESADALLVLLNDILDLSKIEAGKTDINYADVCLAEIVKHVNQRFTQTALENNLDFVFNYENAPEIVNIDEKRVGMDGRGERIEFRTYINDSEDLIDDAGKVVITKAEKQKANQRVELTFINPLEIMNRCRVIVEQDRNLKNNKAVEVIQVE